MPRLLLLTNEVNLSEKIIILWDGIENTEGKIISEEVAIGYGALIEVFIDFLIIGIIVFIIVKLINKLRTKSQYINDKTVVTPKDIELLSDLKNLME